MTGAGWPRWWAWPQGVAAARRLEHKYWRWANVVLAMDIAVLAALRELADEDDAPKLRLYCDGRDVPDPWGGPDDGFAACLAAVEANAEHHLTPRYRRPAKNGPGSSNDRGRSWPGFLLVGVEVFTKP